MRVGEGLVFLNVRFLSLLGYFLFGRLTNLGLLINSQIIKKLIIVFKASLVATSVNPHRYGSGLKGTCKSFIPGYLVPYAPK